MDTERYGVIYADPPWHFRNYSARGEGRNATSHYDCLSPEQLTALPVIVAGRVPPFPHECHGPRRFGRGPRVTQRGYDEVRPVTKMGPFAWG